MTTQADYRDSNGRLDLSDNDSLPWLEADEEHEDAGGVDTAQIVGFGVVLLAILLGVVGAVYWLSNSTSGDDLVADGSTIEAPEGPIKTRPEDPGGKEFAGTGNVAPAVGEGRTREAQIGDEPEAPRPSIDTRSTSEADAPADKPAPAQPAAGAYVQLAAYGSKARAEEGWRDLSRQTEALSGKSHRVVEAQVGGATVYRLQVAAGDRAAAGTLCNAIKADGLDCAVK